MKVKLSELKVWDKNERLHPCTKERMQELKQSLEKHGQILSLLVDGRDNSTILGGNHQFMAMSELGWSEAEAIVKTPQDDKEAMILGMKHNSHYAEYDIPELLKDLEELKLEDLESIHLGMGEIDLKVEKEVEEDEAPPVDDDSEPVSKMGEIYQLGRHRLMCGDSTKIEDVEKLMNGDRADMVFTDPPYGMKLNADYSDMDSKFKGSKGGNRYDNVIGDHDDFSPELIQTVFASFNYCNEIFLWGADYYADLIPNRNDGSWIVWDKRGDDSADKMFGSTFELCWSKARHKRDMARIKWAGIFGMEKEHDKKRVHPTQKPVELVAWFFNQWGEGCNVVTDLFGGSGSTLIACEKTNRHSRLMELDPKYVDVIRKRYAKFINEEDGWEEVTPVIK